MSLDVVCSCNRPRGSVPYSRVAFSGHCAHSMEWGPFVTRPVAAAYNTPHLYFVFTLLLLY